MKDYAMNMTMDITRFGDEKWLWLMNGGHSLGRLVELIQLYLTFWNINHDKTRKDRAFSRKTWSFQNRELLSGTLMPKLALRRTQNR